MRSRHLRGPFRRRLSKRAGLVSLVGGIAIGLAAFAAGAWWPYLRETVPMTWLTTLATFVLLALGTRAFPDRADESAAVDAFFRQINSPETPNTDKEMKA